MTQLEQLHRRVAHSATYTQAQVDGYVRITGVPDDNLLQQWNAWCAMCRLPVVQVWERNDATAVVVDLAFVDRRLCSVELEWLRHWWELSDPFPDAACEMAPHGCTFPGLRRPQALALAQCVLALLQGPPLQG